MKLYVLPVLAFGLLIAANSPGGDAKTDLKKLEGVYILVSGEADGKKLPEQIVKSCTLTIKGDKYTVKVGDDEFSGIQKLDPTKTPKETDATGTDGENKGKTMLGIYKLEEGMFTVYFALFGKNRPKEFSAKTNPGEFMHVWKLKKE